MAKKKSILVLFCILVISVWLIGLADKAGSQNLENIKDATEAWSSHDTMKILSYFTDNCVYEDLAFGVVNHGKGSLRNFIYVMFAAFPDLNIEIKSFSLSGDWYGSEWIISGTHKGDLPNMPATGKKFSIRGATIGELKEGKIKRSSNYYDRMTFQDQIGVMPSPPTSK